jgi:DNA-directed RNA polymerase specialized sigma24 family protein
MLVFSGSAHWERGMVAPNARSERFARWHATHSRALLCAARASCAALRADAVQRLALAHAPMAHLLERHHLDGLPVRDLADELGLTASVVSARLSRARKKLRAILEEMGGGDS